MYLDCTLIQDDTQGKCLWEIFLPRTILYFNSIHDKGELLRWNPL